MARARQFILIFVDGLGLGDIDAPQNPLRDSELEILANFRPRDWVPPPEGGRPESLPAVVRDRALPHGGVVVATDASLGVHGLPQSATGQTTLFTGENAAKVLDRHLYGYPTSTLQKIILRAAIQKRMVKAGKKPAFLNAFRPIFFELGEKVWEKPHSATTWVNHAAGLPFRSFEDLKRERSVYQDITHDSLQTKGFDIPLREPEHAGEILARTSVDYDFALFEFFQTDKAGHAQDAGRARRELRKLDRFLRAVLDTADLKHTTVLLTSDHGNVEDLSRKMHTHNPVPTLVFGPRAESLAGRLPGLEDFAAVILDEMGVTSGTDN